MVAQRAFVQWQGNLKIKRMGQSVGRRLSKKVGGGMGGEEGRKEVGP